MSASTLDDPRPARRTRRRALPFPGAGPGAEGRVPDLSGPGRAAGPEPEVTVRGGTVRGDLRHDVDAAVQLTGRTSQLLRLSGANGCPLRLTPLLADLVAAALDAARFTEGLIDPTIGNALLAVHPGPVAGWQRVHQQGLEVQVPPGVLLDVRATARTDR